MKLEKHIIKAAVSVAVMTVCAGAQAEDRSFWEAAVDTLPGGVVSSEDSAGFFSDTWDGMKKIISDGNTGLLLPAYTIHPGWAYKTEKRHNENGYTWGGGVSRNYIDDRGNRRILYAMLFSDSHSNPEPFIGYGWLSRWRLGDSPLHAELGYTLGLTARGDYKWIPFPAPLPLVGIGTDSLSLYGTFVPFSNIFFFFAQYVTDDRKSRSLPIADENPFNNRVMIYAGGGYQKTDMKGMPYNATTTSQGVSKGGLRFFVTPAWALDFSVTQSATQKIRSQGKKIGSYKLRDYALTVQYHMRASQNTSLYAGLGAGYYRMQNQKFAEGYSGRKGAFSAVVQAGGTYALTKHLHLTAGLELGFARFKGHNPEGRGYSMRPSPATFSAALGFAF